MAIDSHVSLAMANNMMENLEGRNINGKYMYAVLTTSVK